MLHNTSDRFLELVENHRVVLLNLGQFYPQETFGNVWSHFCGSVGVYTCIKWVEAGDSAKHLPMNRAASHNKEFPDPKC